MEGPQDNFRGLGFREKGGLRLESQVLCRSPAFMRVI